MKLPLIVFGVILLVIILAKWYKNRPVKESTPAKENGKTDTSKKKKSFPFGTIITWVIIAAIAWFGYRYFSERTERAGVQERQTPEIAQSQQDWRLCWMKKTEYEGKTAERGRCLPAKIESRSDSHIIISYSYPGGKGVQQGTSTDGKNYSGQWKDSTGWGKWHLKFVKFVSSDTAFGWSDDEDKGEKQPNVLERT